MKNSMQGGLYSEDTDNSSPSQYSFKATGLKDFRKRSVTKNTEICAHSTIVFHKSNTSKGALELTFHTNWKMTELSPHQGSVIQKSPRCLNERRDRGVWLVFFERLKMNETNVFLPSNLLT